MKCRHVIHIDAPPDRVWAVTEDIERWPEWPPTVNSVTRLDQGTFEVGSTALLKQPGLPEAQWVVTALIRGAEFTWESHIRGMRLIATHEIMAAQTGTQNTLQLEISGPVVFLLGPLIRAMVRRSLEQENTGLKNRCESMHSTP